MARSRRTHRRSSPSTRPAATHGTATSAAGARAARPGSASPAARPWRRIGIGLVVALVAVVGGYALLSGSLGGGTAATGPADDGRPAGVVEGIGGRWTEITVDDLAAKLSAKDFTLLNVKTPYPGEIEGTDLYIPYDQLAQRAAELPADKGAELVVYCRSGNQSAIAAQTLVDLGYTNVVNVDGGIVAWVDSGRQVIQLDRS